MKKYEYKFEKIDIKWSYNKEKQEQELLDKLNQLGQEGWEFISMNEYVFGAIFKREINEE